MTNAESPQQADTLTVEQALHQAIAHHQSGQLQDAERLYRAILQFQPGHPDANHNLGVLAVQVKQPVAGLPHFQAALEASPTHGQYWFSYIDALLQAGQTETARETLLLAQQQGLQGEVVEALAGRFQGGVKSAESSAEYQHVFLPDASAAQLNSKEKNPSPQELNALMVLFSEGRYTEAVTLAQTMTVRFPLHGFGWKVLGVLFKQMGRDADALIAMQNAAALSPSDADAHYNLGVNFQDMSRLNEAEASYRRALEIKPDFAEVHSNLGNTLHDMGRLDEAEASYRRALEIKPDFAEVHSNLGNTLHDLGRLDEAELSCRRALEIKPDFAEAHVNLSNTLHDLGRLEEAETCCRRALQIRPNVAVVHNNLGNVHKDRGHLDKAVTSYREALKIKPDYAEAHSNLGNTFYDMGRLDDAEASYRRALEIKPDFVAAHVNLSNTLHDMGRLGEAEVSCRRALEIKPDVAAVYSNLGNTFKDLGRLDDAEASYRRALEIKPNYAEAYDNLLFLYAYHALVDPQEYLAQARNWERACVPAGVRQAAHDRDFQRSPLAGRRLRVGYVSGDYRQHSVSYFVEQLFTHHNRMRIELFAYATQSKRDAVTDRLQALVEHWVPLVGMSDAAIRDRIEADNIDVLIDLSGHTKHNRLGVFARRGAPVQAHYLGYLASTGLTEMDYWIGDEILTPAEADSHFSERVWRLPRVWVSYDGKAEAPVSGWRPSQDGTVWLGSFNNLGKLTPATLVLWAKVLHALPEGKLLLKTKELSDMGNRQRVLGVMVEHGILQDRIEFQDSRATPDWPAHMAYYDRLDIALDPIGGVGGGTTTCDALWMGVPVIACEGDRMASRMTASMLSAIGCTEWIARSEAEYVDRVVTLARDVERRKVLRSGQRTRMNSSPLCDARDLAESLEQAYFEMFERWFDEKN